MEHNIVIAGATGNVGREMLAILAERGFPPARIHALASERSKGRVLEFGDTELNVQVLDEYDWQQADIALFACGSKATKTHAPLAAQAGCVVIDNSSLFRMEDDVPLIVPEVNGHALKDYQARNIIANPNCSTAQLVMALKPLNDIAPIKRVVVATYQSVSGAGQAAMDELFNQTRDVFAGGEIAPAHFTKQMAFNLIPHIDVFLDDGSTKEEWKMMGETKKILAASIAMAVTCVRVPVFIGHSEAVHIEFAAPISEAEARNALSAMAGVEVVDERADGGYITPIECAGSDMTFISRLRRDESVEHGLSLWVVSDNLRKGAALNAVQIAEMLAADYLSKN